MIEINFNYKSLSAFMKYYPLVFKTRDEALTFNTISVQRTHVIAVAVADFHCLLNITAYMYIRKSVIFVPDNHMYSKLTFSK